VRYRRSVHINRAIVARAWLTSSVGRRIHVDGALRDGDEVLAEARCAFPARPARPLPPDPGGTRGSRSLARAAGVKLLSEGRASSVYDLGHGRVLRRFKAGGDPEREELVMVHARSHGFPSPACSSAEPTRSCSNGSTGRRWDRTSRSHRGASGSTSARSPISTKRLHQIRAPDALRAIEDGDALLHLDLHPENVLLSNRACRDRLDELTARNAAARSRVHVDDPEDELGVESVRARRHAPVRALVCARRRAREHRRGPARAIEIRLDDPNIYPARTRPAARARRALTFVPSLRRGSRASALLPIS
jgi:hypothetical protein